MTVPLDNTSLPLTLIQHRGAPNGPGEMENTPEGALQALEDPATRGLEIDIYFDGAEWRVGHDPAPGALSFAAYMFEVGPRLRASKKLLLLEVKTSIVTPEDAYRLTASLAWHGLGPVTTVISFNTKNELKAFATIGFPTGVFVRRTARKGHLDFAGGLRTLDALRPLHPRPTRTVLVYRWGLGPMSAQVLDAAAKACRDRSRPAAPVQLWFSGVGKPHETDAAVDETTRDFNRITAALAAVGLDATIADIINRPSAVRRNYQPK